jgi:primase-polymerase (primpol)-like protein
MIDTTRIPEELQELPQWVGWRLDHHKDRPTKVPMRPDGKGKASVTDPKAWGSIIAAIAAVRRHNYSGIGFVFTADDPYLGIDLDKCRNPETGDLAPWAAEIIDMFPGAYVEASPSGTGVHIITCGRMPGDNHKAAIEGGKVEMYDRERYFTVSGVGL